MGEEAEEKKSEVAGRMKFIKRRRPIQKPPLSIQRPPLSIQRPPLSIQRPPLSIQRPPRLIQRPRFSMQRPPHSMQHKRESHVITMNKEDSLRAVEMLRMCDGLDEEYKEDLSEPLMFMFSLQADYEEFCKEMMDKRQLQVFSGFEMR
uniref:Ovate family protein n=1 Tax=Knipowitschia caucasica TaxID=637954 RepID=A0AAV2J293_KNICA